MHYIDHPDLMVQKCPEFKKLLPPICQELPVDPKVAGELRLVVKAIVNAMGSMDLTNPDEKLLDEINVIRHELFSFWADFCITSQAMSVVGHGVYSVTESNITMQFVKTSLTHPHRTDLVMHAFSMAALADVNEETLTADLLGEDCGVHFTVHNAEPKAEDVSQIAAMVELVQCPTYDDYLNVFKV